MKKLLITLLTAASLKAADVRLGWNPSPTPGVTNYTLYASTNALSATNLQSATVKVNVGTNITVTLTDIAPGLWWLTVTAGKDGIISDPSNILLVDVPSAPINLRTVLVQASINLTNWVDVGFFKLKLP